VCSVVQTLEFYKMAGG